MRTVGAMRRPSCANCLWLMDIRSLPWTGRKIFWSIAEAAQVLEHSELLYKMASEHECWRATRLGLAILALGKSAVRQRIKDRTGL